MTFRCSHEELAGRLARAKAAAAAKDTAPIVARMARGYQPYRQSEPFLLVAPESDEATRARAYLEQLKP